MHIEVRQKITAAYNAVLERPRVSRSIGAALLTTAVALTALEWQDHVENTAEQSAAKIETLEDQNADQMQRTDRLAAIAGALSGIDKETALGANLKPYSELPGYGQQVSEKQEEQMESAAVKLYKSVEGTPYWGTSCSGTYIEIGGQDYVLSAKHCFFDAPAKGGMGPPGVFSGAVDASKYRASPASQGIVGTPTAEVTNIAFATDADFALLSISDPEASLSAELTPLDFTALYDLPATPGEAVTMYSSPASASGAVVHGKGIYLGTVEDTLSSWNFSVDLVGLTNGDTPQGDACNYGASGSSAMLAGGKVLGPLTSRNTLGYAGYPYLDPRDNFANSIRTRFLQESVLGVDLSQFTTICGYGRSNNTAMISQLAQTLDTPQ